MEKLVFFIVVAIYIIAGVAVTRYVKNKDDFYVMSEKGSTILIVGTLAATYLSAVTLLGIGGMIYNEGPVPHAAFGSFGAWLGTLFAVIYVGRKMKSLGCQTIPDFFEKRFNNKWVTIIAVSIMIIALLGYGVVQLIGAGVVLAEILDIPFPILILLFTGALLIFSALGGMFGVVVTDTLMFFTMLAISLIIAPLIIGQAGLDQIKNLGEVIPNYWGVTGAAERPMGWVISQFLMWILFFGCTPALVSRVFPAKNDFVLLKTAVIGIFCAPLMQIFIFLAAAAMQVLQPGIDPADRMFIVGLMDYTPSALAGVGLAGLMASIMSTASTLFVLTGFALAKDLFENVLHKDIDEKKGLILGRLAQVVIAVVVCIIAIMQPSSIFWISVYAGSIFAVSWMPTIIASFEWKRMNSKAAIASMLSGVFSFIVLGELNRNEIIHLSPNFDHFYLSFIISILALLLTGFLTKPNEHEQFYYHQIKTSKLSTSTIQSILKKKNGLAELKSEYRKTFVYAVSFVVISVVLWGYFIVNMAF
ncbi:sodium:solute symporter family protein [Bacillus aerolatus]|uniref:Sodium:solute symporter family protein n=1 Tax=Bacillus aerolatus TaxID=2653354 RepID=A0A6I1FGA0_9BACI|nr:sodium:solute symporter family protein [Bacillus aerolatus]KAB7707193.1 sodium:solute symporter family protein [Bacillus aerolatus]